MWRYLALWSRLSRNFVSSRVCAPFAGLEIPGWGVSRAWTLNGYRYPLSVTRYRNAWNARPRYINFGLRPRGEVDRKEDRRIPEETRATAHANEKRLSSRRTQICGLFRICTCAGTLRSLYRDIFSLPAVAGYRSFAPAKWSERVLQRIPDARRERQGKISFNLLRFLPSLRTGSVWKLTAFCCG